MGDNWAQVLERELKGIGRVDASFVNFVTHAPMPRHGQARLSLLRTSLRNDCEAMQSTTMSPRM